MVLRKASAYSMKPCRPYTRRSRRANRSYIKVFPGIKIAKYNGGDYNAYKENKHPFEVKIVVNQRVQLRDNSIEAARMYVIKQLEAGALGQYYLEVRVHPNHMLRENKSAGGMAGADRVSTGMTQSFGVVIGRAALVPPGKEVLFVSCLNEKVAKIARDALIQVKSKIPGSTTVVFKKVR